MNNMEKLYSIRELLTKTQFYMFRRQIRIDKIEKIIYEIKRIR